MRVKIALLFVILASLACMEPVIVTPTPTSNDINVTTPASPPPAAALFTPTLAATSTATVTPPAAAGDDRGQP